MPYLWIFLRHFSVSVVKLCPEILSLYRTHKNAIHKKGNAKECSNQCTIALISHASKVMLKILQARLEQYMNQELPVFKLNLEKAEEPEIKLPIPTGSQKKKENQKKTSTSASLTTPKPLIVWITANSGKFLKRWEYQTT